MSIMECCSCFEGCSVTFYDESMTSPTFSQCSEAASDNGGEAAGDGEKVGKVVRRKMLVSLDSA